MNKAVFIFLLTVVFCASAFAQSGKRITCPSVKVAEVPQDTLEGELLTFAVEVGPEGIGHDLKYTWRVTESDHPGKAVEISSGQGTPTITVVQVKGSVIAKVEIGGLPRDCPNTSAEISYVHPSFQKCPGIELSGPTSIVSPGKMLDYTVHVETGGEEIELEYVWTAVYVDMETGKRMEAEIVSGQGTPNAQVRMPREGVTVSVIIWGLPVRCPKMASETVRASAAPQAVLLEDFRGPIAKFDKARIEKIRAAQKNDPSAILYVMVGFKPAGAAKSFEKKVFIMENFSQHERYRIVFSNIDEGDVMQIWLVQPGAVYPKFKASGGK